MNITEKQNTSFTPMMTQYLEIKKDYKDTILFFRLGDFYEMFFDDAKIASSILGLALTCREAGKNNRVPMCGIPYHAADNYIARLIKSSQKVAICEQVEDPKIAKGIVRREIVRVITPGTLMGENVLDKAHNNYLVAVCGGEKENFGLAAADLSTGEFNLTEVDTFQKLLGELARLKPAELLLNSLLKENAGLMEKIRLISGAALSDVDDWTFDFASAYDKITSHFKTQSLHGFGCDEMRLGVGAAGAVLYYLEETQKTAPTHIKKIKPYSLNKFMILDAIAQRNLELINPMRGNKKTTLLETINFTHTPMGKRLLVQWIQQPLIEMAQINKRLDSVEELFKSQSLLKQLAETLKNIGDLERLLGRISLNIAGARDAQSLNQSLKIIPQLKNQLKETKSEMLVSIRDDMDECEELSMLIDKSVREDAPLSVRDGGMIKRGFNKELDDLLDITRGGKSWMASLQQEEIKRTGISSLKVKYNSVFGYYIEVTMANLHLVPQDYIRKQTLVGAERFITPALKEQEEKILNAEEKIVELEYKLFMEVCSEILNNMAAIQENARAIAALDVLSSLSSAALYNSYTRPKLTDGLNIKITGGRHPVLENILPTGKCIPNDTILDGDKNQILIITGPNMAGKSTYIRSVALIALLAQMGSFVPASSAKIGIVDRIFTRVGAADDISSGMSTFMMEMNETANILNNATTRSLVILDEIGRGTSTFDGLSIAWAVAEYLHNNKEANPRTLFATHYHELAELELTLPKVKNYNVAVREWKDEVTFLYKLVKGFADHSYGIHVGRLAGLPIGVINRAKEILNNLEINPVRKNCSLSGCDGLVGNKFSNGVNSLSKDGIPSLVKSDRMERKKSAESKEPWQKENPVLEEIKKTDVNSLTPLAALDLIDKWKGKLQDDGE